MTKDQIIPIFFATDDRYVPYLGVAIKSITENCHPMFKYQVHVLNTGLNKQNMDKIKTLETDFLKIEFNDISNKIAAIKATLDENLRDYYSDAIFYRIFIPSMFPQYDRAIYLDCDIVVIGDISRMFFTDIKGNYLASVLDEVAPSNPVLVKYVEKAVGVPINQYFCSGVILFDLLAMREHQIEHKFIGLLNKYNFDTIAPDQDYLNVICKNKVYYLHQGWDRQANKRKYNDDIYIVHYNMFRKPWLYKKVPYESYFWQYAAMTPFYNDILKTRDSFTKEQKAANIKGARKMIYSCSMMLQNPITFKSILDKMSIEEALEMPTVKNLEELSIPERIEQFEKLGGEFFNTDVLIDPPTKPLKNVDYLKKNPIHKIQAWIANSIAKSYRKKLKKQLNVKIEGVENLKDLKTGAILTHNHFSTADSIPVYWAINEIKPKRKMWTIVREGNWNMPGLTGFFLKHSNTLPISENYHNMVNLDKAITKLLNKKDIIVIYPEQAMWPDYRKPRPQKLGAFTYAFKNDVPVIPCFTTVNDKNEFTIHVMPLIYPDKTLNRKLGAIKMRDQNYECFVKKYEEVYGKKLEYACDKNNKK